nr:MAG TPA: hypothetical protein [Caudoviricetes sp.]
MFNLGGRGWIRTSHVILSTDFRPRIPEKLRAFSCFYNSNHTS